MNKNLLYTAVTRARKCVCMVGNENCFHQMAQNESEQRRYSSLDERIKEIYELYINKCIYIYKNTIIFNIFYMKY